jgi:lipopolysaccharide transport system ATP-binding protein
VDAIAVQGLSKKYVLEHTQHATYATLRDAIAGRARELVRAVGRGFRRAPTPVPAHEDFWALKDVDFRIGEGDRVGIIGRNGAGKSTLLKVLSRITEPTRGAVRLTGRVASLLEVGTGFHPELTGRENIFLNGAVLGMTRAETRRKFDEIVEFAEVERFLDTPVKRYSSGMSVRLAFAVAAHLEPEILIVDEVLAVGDAQFQKKCLGKMEDVGRSGRTVLFVSHNLAAVQRLTEKCIVLEKGEVLFDGDTRQGVERYLTMAETRTGENGAPDVSFYRPSRYHPDRGPVTIEGITFGGVGSGEPVVELGADFTVQVELSVRAPIRGATVSCTLLNVEGQIAAVLFSGDRGFAVDLDPGRRVVTLTVKGLPLAPGRYTVNVGVNQSTDQTAWDGIGNYPAFEVRNAGRVVHWLHRPWGSVHWDDVEWGYQAPRKEDP